MTAGELALIIIPVILGLVITNYRPLWNPVKRNLIDPLHIAGHGLFGALSGSFPKITSDKKPGAGHEMNIDKKGAKVVALLMGHPFPAIWGVAVIASAIHLHPNPFSALVLLFGVVLASGGLNGLIDLTFFTPKGVVTDAALLEQVTKVDARRWVTVVWLITLALSALVALAILA